MPKLGGSYGTYAAKTGGMPGARVVRGKTGLFTPAPGAGGTYSAKGAGMPGARVNRGN
ncbi:MAG: hypothetical protein JW384_03420 [Nitrosomonadaceae bacterium]|nr:hypothetical protein [Nitrosomonadaceae bacterium]